MKFVYSVQSDLEYKEFNTFYTHNIGKINNYIDFIAEVYNVEFLPEYIVLSNFEMATRVHSNITIPAYTNDIRMVINPDIEVWRDIYLKQLEGYTEDNRLNTVKNHYVEEMSENYILQIIGHELTHHSEFFLDDGETWFEEGMVEYISRKYFLTEGEYELERYSNRILIDLFEEKFGCKPLNEFDSLRYHENYAEILYYYWRSFLTIELLVNTLGSIENVFDSYHKWDKEGRVVTLTEWFDVH